MSIDPLVLIAALLIPMIVATIYNRRLSPKLQQVIRVWKYVDARYVKNPTFLFSEFGMDKMDMHPEWRRLNR